ncbi:class I SAM-dependent methyltransferase [Aliidiomarina quisquiliarum]|uniref:class I SAM-dependent methyltransferase n=1 Tax=Aliidiomarina quisquiliarum TaxID=2938947 RepID=UPI00208FDDA7|nr:class I SAM-dependent methyltransferase [Aliidiomarina quisquiliarum]MCO4322546.1 class I SAM-dependent methyltransferase [Aliidiomarina quisquiliarum]
MKHWSQFWRASSSLSSFSEGAAAQGYSGEVKDFWVDAVKGLANDAVIVDIGTGNGALAVLLNDYRQAEKLNWQLHGVDAADIAPKDLEAANESLKGRFDGIEFHSKTDMSAMPFADASVDCVVSQFAFEYGDEKEVLNEIMRVLKPGGRFIMMGHHKKSTVHKSTETGIQVLQYILHETPLFIQADLYLRMASQALRSLDIQAYQATQEGQAAGKTVEWLLYHIQDKYKKEDEQMWVADVGNRVMQLVSEPKTAAEASQAMHDLNIQYQLLASHILRMQDMAAAAKTETQVKKLITAAKKVGAVGEFDVMMADDDVFAWLLTLEKGAA